MAHGGYPRRGAAFRRPKSSASAAVADRKRKRTAVVKTASLKNQIRSTERFLRKDLPDDIRIAQEKKLEELKRQQELQNQLAVQRTVQLRDRKIKFFERRKIERMIRRLEKQQRSNGDDVSNKLSRLREDLEYVRFFPKNEKYVSLFTGGNLEVVEERSKWRKQIKESLMAAAASGKDLEGNQLPVLQVGQHLVCQAMKRTSAREMPEFLCHHLAPWLQIEPDLQINV
nr:unnamed protein product [Digitaria exilis]